MVSAHQREHSREQKACEGKAFKHNMKNFLIQIPMSAVGKSQQRPQNSLPVTLQRAHTGGGIRAVLGTPLLPAP